ncbi:ATP-dependent DNA helicase RecG [Candidatus Saccharibacteria bacterium oral taxon 955]|nr:ATP-dependent DNA helicase RecG [Candidatus Saccharibacteria bacterium oral taxon 955]QJU05913.1 ATP-dependent DNA helicase RecG [Candidatus Saccharibacteria bacterium oral taxon 955]
MNLKTPLEQVKGVGPKVAMQLRTAGLETVGDIITFLPRRHDDFTGLAPIADLKPGKVTIRARCESISTRPVRRGLRLTTAVLADDSGKLNAIWFNQPYRTQQLGGSDDEFYFSGEFEYNYGRYQLTNPTAEIAKDMPVQAERLMPVYHSIHGLKSVTVRKVVEKLRPLMSVLPETLPASIVRAEGLMGRAEAISAMHFPKTTEEVQRARDRLAFEELFELLLASRLNKLENQQLEGYHIPFEQAVVKQFVSNLPFTLTSAQRRAAWDILQDFERKTPMNRLLQGDVGSGKTVVAGLAARQAASHGFQTALMAPTEILASQHAETLDKLLAPFGVRVGLLVGSLKGKARQALYEQIANGEVDAVVGTHAVIQDKVSFKKLGFVVIDEQHRFGVDQRQKLLAKSGADGLMPHLLAMTATPIPRSLALTVYGELDLSILNERPKGRIPIKTEIVTPVGVPKMYERVDAEIANGRQAYVVCSLIDDNPENDTKSVTAEHQRLKQTIFGHRQIGLLHGKMKPAEKETIMQDFKARKYDILVSTTVVEVGVDVPNATTMIIENADRFGLSQLHQLRGRVGRGSHQSYCYLVMSSSNKPSERIREIEKSDDGFYLAEVDMKLRGPGEIYGRMQHGALNLQIATLADTALIARAQNAVKRFVKSPEEVARYKTTNSRVQYYQRLTTLN